MRCIGQAGHCLHPLGPAAPHLQTGKPGGIPLNSRGVLVSCVSGKEHQAARETISLLTEVCTTALRACVGGRQRGLGGEGCYALAGAGALN